MSSILWGLGSTTGLDPDRLYAVRGGWSRPSPIFCPHGHRLGPGRVLVGTLACATVGTHQTWTCRSCEAAICWPPMTDACTHPRHGWQ